MATATASTKAKKGGDISDAFVSLSQTTRLALLDDYRQLKLALVEGREDAMVAGWTRLLQQLRAEVREVEQKGSEIIPRVKFEHLNGGLSEDQKSEIFKRGVIIVEDVVDEKEARGYKTAVEDYVHANPQTKGVPLPPPFRRLRKKYELTIPQAILKTIPRSSNSTGPLPRSQPAPIPTYWRRSGC